LIAVKKKSDTIVTLPFKLISVFFAVSVPFAMVLLLHVRILDVSMAERDVIFEEYRQE
jgi:hypothetical protein